MIIYDVIPFLSDVWHRPGLRRRLRKAIRTGAAQADAIIVPSPQIKEDVIAVLGAGSSNIHVLPGSVSQTFSPVDDAAGAAVRQSYGIEKPYLLYVGTIELRKNLPVLIKSFRKLQKECGNRFQLVLAGGYGWGYTRIRTMVNHENDKRDIIVTGYLPEKCLVPVYRGASVVVYPSPCEGFGFPPLEAMACGVPVIAAASCPLCTMAGDAVIPFDPNTVPALFQSIRRVLFDPALRDALRERGRHRTRDFLSTRIAQQFLDIVEQIGVCNAEAR